MTVIGILNTNESITKKIINSKLIPKRKIILKLEEGVLNGIPKEWIEFENGNFLSLGYLKSIKNTSLTGKALYYLSEGIKETEEIKEGYQFNYYNKDTQWDEELVYFTHKNRKLELDLKRNTLSIKKS